VSAAKCVLAWLTPIYRKRRVKIFGSNTTRSLVLGLESPTSRSLLCGVSLLSPQFLISECSASMTTRNRILTVRRSPASSKKICHHQAFLLTTPLLTLFFFSFPPRQPSPTPNEAPVFSVNPQEGVPPAYDRRLNCPLRFRSFLVGPLLHCCLKPTLAPLPFCLGFFDGRDLIFAVRRGFQRIRRVFV